VANGADNTTERRPGARPWLIVASVALIVVVDQLTKAWAVSSLDQGPKNVIGDTVKFELARNSGAAFSRFQGYTPVVAVLAIVITVVIARTARKATDPWLMAGLILVLGGAIGNLCDRIFRDPGFLRGHVIDFVAVGWWPVFNVADSCITIGAVLLIVRTLFAPEHQDAPKPHDADA
jgi:signal peptidase II